MPLTDFARLTQTDEGLPLQDTPLFKAIGNLGKSAREVKASEESQPDALMELADLFESLDDSLNEKPKAASKSRGDGSRITGSGGAIRNLPAHPALLQRLDNALARTDSRLGARIVSAAQPRKGSGGKRTGSTRHDKTDPQGGFAVDIVLTLDGKDVRPDQDRQLYAKFLREAGGDFKGIGHYDWGLHVDTVAPGMWGPDTTGRTLDPFFAEAIRSGRENRPFEALDPGSTRTRTSQGKSGEDNLFDAISASLDSSAVQAGPDGLRGSIDPFGGSDTSPAIALSTTPDPIDNSPSSVMGQVFAGIAAGLQDFAAKAEEERRKAPQMGFLSSSLRSMMGSQTRASPSVGAIRQSVG